MNTTFIFFCIFAAVLLVAAFRVITARSPVHAALFLVLAFFSAACLWVLLEAEFLAITLVLVYVGAVMVLFLFVVMMLDMNSEAFREGFWTHFPVAAVVGVVIALEMALVLIPGFDVRRAPTDPQLAQMGNTKLLGIELYTHYLYPLQIAAVLLLVAIIAAIALTLRRRKDSKYVNPSDQIHVKRADRVRLVKMQPTVEAPDQAPPTDPAPAGDKA
ncbi:MAG: NADH-quinone oxidoreductase subunit J [Pseudomonadota bacterium]